jgi:hypothetical protein
MSSHPLPSSKSRRNVQVPTTCQTLLSQSVGHRLEVARTRGSSSNDLDLQPYRPSRHGLVSGNLGVGSTIVRR